MGKNSLQLQQQPKYNHEKELQADPEILVKRQVSDLFDYDCYFIRGIFFLFSVRCALRILFGNFLPGVEALRN